MNVALPALVVFLALLPGFIIRSRLKRVERLSLDYSPFGQVVTEAVLWSILAHGFWLLLAAVFFQRELQPEVLLKLTSSDSASQASAAGAVAKEWWWISAYFTSLYLAAYCLPTLARVGISALRLDRYGHPLSRLLRFYGAPWYYLLTGADFEKNKAPDLISISAIVDVGGSPFLYVGFLAEFFLDHDGKLDRVVLEQVIRRPIHADKTHSQAATNAQGESDDKERWTRFYPVDGDYFVLRYSEVTTLNIEYIKLQQVEAGP